MRGVCDTATPEGASRTCVAGVRLTNCQLSRAARKQDQRRHLPCFLGPAHLFRDRRGVPLIDPDEVCGCCCCCCAASSLEETEFHISNIGGGDGGGGDDDVGVTSRTYTRAHGPGTTPRGLRHTELRCARAGGGGGGIVGRRGEGAGSPPLRVTGPGTCPSALCNAAPPRRSPDRSQVLRGGCADKSKRSADRSRRGVNHSIFCFLSKYSLTTIYMVTYLSTYFIT